MDLCLVAICLFVANNPLLLYITTAYPIPVITVHQTDSLFSNSLLVWIGDCVRHSACIYNSYLKCEDAIFVSRSILTRKQDASGKQ